MIPETSSIFSPLSRSRGWRVSLFFFAVDYFFFLPHTLDQQGDSRYVAAATSLLSSSAPPSLLSRPLKTQPG